MRRRWHRWGGSEGTDATPGVAVNSANLDAALALRFSGEQASPDIHRRCTSFDTFCLKVENDRRVN